MNDTVITPAPRIEYVLEGHYLQPNGTRKWREHSYADTHDKAFNPNLGVDETGLKVHQPSEWRITERDLNTLYSVQGFYRCHGSKNRQWLDHTLRVDFANARAVYCWFHRHCQDPDYDSPNNARVINMGTGKVVPMEGFVEPVKQPGDAMRTIPVTPAEWEAIQYSCGWDSAPRRSTRRDGTYIWKIGRDYILGYEDAEGNVRVRPSAYTPANEEASLATDA